MSDTSQFVLVVADGTLPQARTLGTGLGLALEDNGAGQVLDIVPANLLGSMQGLVTTGIIVNTNSNTAVNRSVISTDSTVTVVNGNGVSGNIDLGINDDSTSQKVFVWENGQPTSNRGALNFVGATIQDNPGSNSCDIIIPSPQGGTAPASATYITQTPNASLTNEQPLSLLATGIMKSTTSTGVVSIAAAGTDYVAPSANLTALAGLANTTGSLLAMNGTTLVNLGVGTNGQVLGVSSGTPTWTSDTGFTNPMTTQGDVIVGGTAGAPARLAVGANGQVLGVSGGVPAWTSDTGFTNPMTTAGDTIVGTTGGVAVRLAGGSNGQVLAISGGTPGWTSLAAIPNAAAKYIVQTADASIPNAQDLSALPTGLMKSTAITGVVSIASSGVDYVAPSTNLTAVAALAVTKGSILVCDGTNINELAVGTDGKAIIADSTQATGLNYASLATNPMTTQGDIIVGGTAGAPARLAKGTANQVLAMDGTGTNEVWATPLSSTMTSLSIPFTTTLPGGTLPGGQILFTTSVSAYSWFTLSAGVWTVNIYGYLGMNSANTAAFVTFNFAQQGVGTLYSFSTPLAPGTNAGAPYYGSITFYTAGGSFGVTQSTTYGSPYANGWTLSVDAYKLSNNQDNSNNGLPYSH